MLHSRNAHPTRSIRNRYSHTQSNVKSFEVKPMQDDLIKQSLRSVDRRVSLTTLDEDVALQILSDLDVGDVISLRKVRRVFYNIFKKNSMRCDNHTILTNSDIKGSHRPLARSNSLAQCLCIKCPLSKSSNPQPSVPVPDLQVFRRRSFIDIGGIGDPHSRIPRSSRQLDVSCADSHILCQTQDEGDEGTITSIPSFADGTRCYQRLCT